MIQVRKYIHIISMLFFAGFACWLFFAITGTGCSSEGSIAGYHSGNLYPDNIRTVAVDIFNNRSFQRGVESEVTEALIKKIELMTPYKVVSIDKADSVITGTILSVNRHVLNRTSDGAMPMEVEVAITATFRWEELRTGKVICKRSQIIGTGYHVPVRPVSEPYEVAANTAADVLALRMVSVMQKDW